MNVPNEYASWVYSLGFTECNFGYCGLRIFTPRELEERQTGYSKLPTGESLCDDKPGGWQPEWIVIGYDTMLGDPIILDTTSANLQVMTSVHGVGAWEPDPIADSLEGFGKALVAVKNISAGRENPVALENNPPTTEELTDALELIRQVIGDGVDLDFWELFLESDLN